MSDLSSIPWLRVITIVVGNGVLTILITWAREARREREGRDRDGRYIALRLVAVLERFAWECAELVYENKDADPYSEHNQSGRTKLPELGQYPTDADWKALQPLLASRAFSLPTEITLAMGQIRFWWDVAVDQDAALVEASEQAGKCGYRAWILATELRRRYKLPPSHLLEVTLSWVDELRAKHDTAMQRVSEQRAEAAEDAKERASTKR